MWNPVWVPGWVEFPGIIGGGSNDLHALAVAMSGMEGWGWPRNIWSLVYALMQGKIRRKMGHHSYQVNSYKASNIIHLLLFSR